MHDLATDTVLLAGAVHEKGSGRLNRGIGQGCN